MEIQIRSKNGSREIARPQRGAVKLEPHRDGYVRARRIGRGKRGQALRLSLDTHATNAIVATVVTARDELLAADTSSAAGRERVAARRTALDRFEHAQRQITELLDGQADDSDVREARDLTRRNLDELAMAPVGTVVYAKPPGAPSEAPPRDVRGVVSELRARIELRGLVLVTLDSSRWYHRIDVHRDVKPVNCSVCGYHRIAFGRCQRCQTRAA